MEGVDRNAFDHMEDDDDAESPSAWRVWIEMPHTECAVHLAGVTLRMEGVDRNIPCVLNIHRTVSHPPHGGCG